MVSLKNGRYIGSDVVHRVSLLPPIALVVVMVLERVGELWSGAADLYPWKPPSASELSRRRRVGFTAGERSGCVERLQLHRKSSRKAE